MKLSCASCWSNALCVDNKIWVGSKAIGQVGNKFKLLRLIVFKKIALLQEVLDPWIFGLWNIPTEHSVPGRLSCSHRLPQSSAAGSCWGIELEGSLLWPCISLLANSITHVYLIFKKINKLFKMRRGKGLTSSSKYKYKLITKITIHPTIPCLWLLG